MNTENFQTTIPGLEMETPAQNKRTTVLIEGAAAPSSLGAAALRYPNPDALLAEKIELEERLEELKAESHQLIRQLRATNILLEGLEK